MFYVKEQRYAINQLKHDETGYFRCSSFEIIDHTKEIYVSTKLITNLQYWRLVEKLGTLSLCQNISVDFKHWQNKGVTESAAPAAVSYEEALLFAIVLGCRLPTVDELIMLSSLKENPTVRYFSDERKSVGEWTMSEYKGYDEFEYFVAAPNGDNQLLLFFPGEPYRYDPTSHFSRRAPNNTGFRIIQDVVIRL